MKATRFTITPTHEARFWSKVDKRSPSECWEWQGARQGNKWNYGRLTAGGRWFTAHRFSWEIANGPRPQGAVIRHTCDNPPCVNPAHLVIGTLADNTRDMHERGRAGDTALRGTRNHAAKLTPDDVRHLRADRDKGMSWTALGAKYGVDRSTARSAALGHNWRNLT